MCCFCSSCSSQPDKLRNILKFLSWSSFIWNWTEWAGVSQWQLGQGGDWAALRHASQVDYCHDLDHRQDGDHRQDVDHQEDAGYHQDADQHHTIRNHHLWWPHICAAQERQSLYRPNVSTVRQRWQWKNWLQGNEHVLSVNLIWLWRSWLLSRSLWWPPTWPQLEARKISWDGLSGCTTRMALVSWLSLSLSLSLSFLFLCFGLFEFTKERLWYQLVGIAEDDDNDCCDL